jgi:hypothetical protein
MRRRPKGEVRYAVLQHTMEVPAVDRLRRAFESVRSLTAADAPGLANDAYGAYLLRADPPTSHTYPSRNAFYEEIAWMLWQAAKRDRGER